ncbi:MAG: hypothetical protein R3220_11765 [Balneolaceae bacterium]|nr:hypothetical protein [Balneolaceae bacterium]
MEIRERINLFKIVIVIIFAGQLLVLPSCENATNSTRDLTVEMLQIDPLFISFADAYVSYVEPTLMKTWSSEMVVELEQKAEFLEESESADPQVLEEILHLMGYSDIREFKELQTNLIKSIKNMEMRYPGLNFDRPDNRKNQMVISELEKYIDINHPNLFRNTNSLDSSVRYKCKDGAGLKECLSDVRRAYLYRTAACGAGALFSANIFVGAGCQAVNILWHESEKRDCLDDNC